MIIDREQLDIGTQLDNARDDLDRLIAEVHGGIRSQLHYDEIEGRTQAIARKLQSAVRRRGSFAGLRR